MKQKIIVFISTLEHLPWGGCEDLWYKTALHALSEGNSVIVLVFKHNTIPAHLKSLEKAGATIFFLQRPHQPRSFLMKIKNKLMPVKLHQKILGRLKKEIQGRSYSVVVSQAGGFDFCYAYLDEIAEWLLSNTAPVQVIIQNVPDLGFSVSRHQASKQRAVFYAAKSVFFVSKRNHISAERILASAINNARIVNNPLNIAEREVPLPFPDIEAKISFAEVAALRCFHKGQDILLQVLSSVKWKSRNWELNLYGEGPDKEYLMALAKFLKINERINFHGHVTDIRTVWQTNHIHILPSLGEGTPLALIESMYCGRPAVTTDVGGNAEYCEQNNSGFICDYPTPAALERAMEDAWIKKDQWQIMGLSAYEKIESGYDLNAIKTMYQMITEN